MATQSYGYSAGQPFGDPNKFTRSTGEDEVDRFNDWMRTTPEWQSARGTSTGDWSDQQANQLTQSLAARGITLPKDFHIDQGGNFNQKSRVKRNLAIAGLLGAGALTAGGAFGMGPMAGLFGGAGGAGSTAAAAGTGLGGAAGVGGTTALPGLAGTLSAGSMIGGSAATGAGSSMGIGSTLLGLGKKFGSGLLSGGGSEAASRALSAGSQAAASNRGTMAEVMLDRNSDLERQLLAREEEKRKARNDAYKNSIAGQRMMTWNPLQRPAGIPGSYRAPSEGMRATGNELFQQAMARMNAPDLAGPQGMPAYRNMNDDKQFNDQLKPGIMERASGIGSYTLPIISRLLGK